MLNCLTEQYLQAFVHNKRSTWGKFLMWAEWSYNTSRHSSTWVSPSEVTFGKKPPIFPQHLAETFRIEAMDDILINRKVVFTSLKKKLFKSRESMKQIVDTSNTGVDFKTGD